MRGSRCCRPAWSQSGKHSAKAWIFCLGPMQAGEEWSVKREETAYEEQIF